LKAEVALCACPDYEPETVSRAVSRLLELTGGFSSMVAPGSSVLLKPNLLSARSPDRAVTTHPAVLDPLIDAVRDLGGEPSIGDSPGGALRGVERVWRNTGMAELSERKGVPLVNFEAASSVEMRGRLRSYMIAQPVVDADVVINVAKMKTHVLTAYTGCVKNMFGAVPGFAKGRLHSEAPRPVPFSRHIVDIYSLVRPAFHVMDAVVGMEGDGPSGGAPRKVGALLGGTDGVAVDAVATMMMGFGEATVPMLRIAEERGLGTATLSEIEIVGDAVDRFDTSGFALPRPGLLNLVPSFLVRALRPFVWVYPEMSKEWGCRAEACGLCVRSCPVSAIEMTGRGPVVDRRACVECLCCHEVCPHDAVRVKLSWLAGKFA